MTTNYLSVRRDCIKASHRGPFNKHALSAVTWWVLGHSDQADSTQHRKELNSLYTSLYTGLYTRLYHIRFISKTFNINCLAAIEAEWLLAHKVGVTKNIYLSAAIEVEWRFVHKVGTN